VKKILCLLLVLIIPLILFSGCKNKINISDSEYTRFYIIDYNHYVTVYVDKETRVMYLFVKNDYKGGLTAMLNPDGTPMLWEGELEGENK
jgi:hypothetical protein